MTDTYSLARGGAGSNDLLRRQLTRAVVAATIGAVVEWYDFLLYGLAASLVFGRLFFPGHDPLLSTLSAYGTFFLGFAARPLGAIAFGHFGDRIGRKATLIVTLLLMGASTFAIGLLPTYATAGVWAAVLLVALRVVQGIGLGGEWAGGMLLTLEWANANLGTGVLSRSRRGLLTGLAQGGVGIGASLATFALLLSLGQFGVGGAGWGWRLPFLASAVIVFVGLYIRLGVLETPVFSALLERRQIVRAPVIETLRRQWREVLLVVGTRLGESAPVFLFQTFILVYATSVLGYPAVQVLTWIAVAQLVQVFTNPFWGAISDRIGRRRLIVIGALTMAVFGFLYYGLLDTRVPALAAAAILLSFVVHDIQYGAQAALVPESFTGRLRYTGASLAFNLAASVGGGGSPIVAVAIYRATGSSAAIAAYIAACALVTIVSVAFLRDRSHQDLSVEYDEPAA
jgi:MFS family permease